jgi:hypothetical protein
MTDTLMYILTDRTIGIFAMWGAAIANLTVAVLSWKARKKIEKVKTIVTRPFRIYGTLAGASDETLPKERKWELFNEAMQEMSEQINDL